jgi:hypothetical protein
MSHIAFNNPGDSNMSLRDAQQSVAGAPIAPDLKDLNMHVMVFGSTGSGKTSREMRPRIVEWIRADCGGVFILDGKGDVAADFRGVKDFLLIEPGVPLALLEGLSPTDIVEALRAHRSSGPVEFWEAQAYRMIHAGATFLEAVILAEKAKHNYSDDDKDRQAHWHAHGLLRLLSRAQQGTVEDAQTMADLIALVRQQVPLANVAGVLFDLIEYLEVTVPSMDSRTRGDIWATVQNQLRPLLSDSRLLPWAHCEKGVDVDVVLRGGKAGIALPAAEYGISGSLVQCFLKQRLAARIMRRHTYDWRAEGEKPVLLAIDEADKLVGTGTDMRVLTQARSLGLFCLFATRSFENCVSRFGDAGAAREFIDNFRSKVALGSTREEIVKLLEGAHGTKINFEPSVFKSSVFKSFLRKCGRLFTSNRHAGKGVRRDGWIEPLYKIPADLIQQPEEKAHEPA